MIKDNFYPDDVTDTTTGITFSAFTENIDGIADSMADAYLMGYIPPEMVAPSFRPVILSGGGDSVSAVYDYSQNYGWGYIFRQSSADGTGGVNYVNQNGVYTRLYNVNPDYRFINSAEMSKYCTNDTVTINIAALRINKDYWDSSKMATTQMVNAANAALIANVQQTYTFAQWRDIIKNDTIFYNNTVQGHTITLRPSDFGDSNDPDALHVKFFESGNYIIRADIYNYVIGATHYMNLNAGYSNYIITPFVQTKISAAGLPDTVADVIPGTNLQHFLWMRYTNGSLSFERGQTTGANNYDYIPDYNITFGGFNNGIVSVSDIDFSTASNTARLGFVRNWYFNYDNGVFRIVPTFTPLDIYHHIMLFHKHTNTPANDYSSADTVTVFTNDDAPTMDTVSGNLSEIAARLRPWQFPAVDITANKFTPDDIPDVEPDTDYDSTGDDIRDTDFNVSVIGAGNNFVTLYAMSSYGVSDMGKQLWASLSDPTYWQTVGTVFSNDFSINPADMLKYFLSLRYFPFNLSDLPHLTSPGVFIGRASAPLSPSTGIPFPLRLRKSICQLDGGSLTIRRKYNDFRDYEPCTTVQIHVPFCGTVDVPASEVVGKTLYLTYKIDLQTGAMLGVIAVQSNTYYVIATVAGSCGASIPITANNNIEFLQRIATVAGSGISGGISGGIKGASVGGEVGAVAGAIAGSVGGGVGALAGLPPVTVHKQGNASGFANLGGVPCAYVTIQRQRYTIPENYGHTSGYACDVSETVGNLSGFAVCENVDTSGLTCNATERAEIKRLLESGIYI